MTFWEHVDFLKQNLYIFYKEFRTTIKNKKYKEYFVLYKSI